MFFETVLEIEFFKVLTFNFMIVFQAEHNILMQQTKQQSIQMSLKELSM